MITKQQEICPIDSQIAGLIVASCLNSTIQNRVAQLIVYDLKLLSRENFYGWINTVKYKVANIKFLYTFRSQKFFCEAESDGINSIQSCLNKLYTDLAGKHYSVDIHFPLMFLGYFRITSFFA